MNEEKDIVRDLLNMLNSVFDKDDIKLKAMLKRAKDFINKNSDNCMTVEQVIAKLKEMYGNNFYNRVSAGTGIEYNTEYPEIWLFIHEENTLNIVKDTFDNIANIVEIRYVGKIVAA